MVLLGQSDQRTPTLDELCALVRLRLRSLRLRREGMTLADFVRRLTEERQYVDAIRCVPYTLTLTEAVHWACLCTECSFTHSPEPPPEQVRALTAAFEWFLAPSQHHQILARAAADAAGFSSPAGCCALAASLAGHSNNPMAPVSPFRPEQARKQAALAAIHGSKAAAGANRSDLFKQFLSIGAELSNQDHSHRSPATAQHSIENPWEGT